jgi:Flp pilus assembly pilin Flp
MLRRLKDTLLALHRDEKGADMVEYILIVAAVALPLVAVMIWFWKDISAWAGDLWEEVRSGDAETEPEFDGH